MRKMTILAATILLTLSGCMTMKPRIVDDFTPPQARNDAKPQLADCDRVHEPAGTEDADGKETNDTVHPAVIPCLAKTILSAIPRTR